MPTQTNDLLTYLFDGRSNPLQRPVATWLASSRRFAAFATTFRDKIRKKLRTTQDRNGLLDLQVELETAYLLLRERALSVAYEPEQSKGIRSPDFAVTFTTSLTFMVEVTRVQPELKNGAGEIREAAVLPPPAPMLPISPLGTRLVDAVVSKLGQLMPQRANVLLVVIERALSLPSDLRDAMLSIQQRAERNDSTILPGYGFLDRADFFRQYQRLSEILVRVPNVDGAKSMVTWINLQAKYPLPGKVRTALHRAITG